MRKKISDRMDQKHFSPVCDDDSELQSFDLIRASVNLMVASALISFATSLKLPLSTTYVSGSLWASGGTIAETGGVITWDGVVDANITLTATFVVQVPASVPTRTAIINRAILTGTEDVDSPHTLLAVTIIQPFRWYFPRFLLGH